MLNHIILMGRLVDDPQLKTTTTNVEVCTFRIAVNRKYKGKNNEQLTDFFNIVCWRGTAKFAADYFKKGQQIAVDGRAEMRTYTDKNDVKRTIFEVIAEYLCFADSKKSDEKSTEEKTNASAPALSNDFNYDDFEQMGFEDDGDLPF